VMRRMKATNTCQQGYAKRPAAAGADCALLLGQRGGRAFDAHAGKAVQPDHLDQRPDLRLGAAQQDRASVGPQAPGDHRQIEHQRRVREDEFAEVNDDVSLRANRSREGLAPASLRRPILVSPASQGRRLVIEINDAGNLPKPRVLMQAFAQRYLPVSTSQTVGAPDS